jgi:hypothetical protein
MRTKMCLTIVVVAAMSVVGGEDCDSNGRGGGNIGSKKGVYGPGGSYAVYFF